MVSISTHDLTKRSTDCQNSTKRLWVYFNSRPHEEVDDGYEPYTQTIDGNFNSRPHEEVDRPSRSAKHHNPIFQLTTSRRGRRYTQPVVAIYDDISTHDLTKRSTHTRLHCCSPAPYFNSRPHEEVDLCQYRSVLLL